MPWMAQEAGLFKKYNFDHELVFIASSGIVTAALLGGDADMTVTGGIGNVIAYVRGSTDVVFIGGVKNIMTQTLGGRRQYQKAGRSQRQTDRRKPNRRQLTLLYDSGAAPLQHGAESRF